MGIHSFGIPSVGRYRDMSPRRETTSLRNLWRYLAFSLPYKWSLGAGIVTGIIRVGLGLFLPWLTKYMLDDVCVPLLNHKIDAAVAWSRVTTFTELLLGVLVVHGVVTLGRWYYPNQAAANALRDIRFNLFRHLQRLSLGFHHQRPTGAMVARLIADVEVAQNAFDAIFIQLSQQVMNASVVSCVLFSMDWRWGLVTFAATPLFLITTRLIRHPMRRATRQQRETIARMSGIVQERFSMIREVQAFTAEDHEEQQVLDQAEILRQHTLRQRLLHAIMVASSEITRTLAMAAVVLYGVYRIIQGDPAVTVGTITLFSAYSTRILGPLEFFAELYTALQISAAAADRVFEFFDTDPDIKDSPGAKPLELSAPPTVRFQHVCFSYPTEKPVVVLEDIDFEIPPGSKIVLVGPSGGGKSTMMSLVPRFYDVQRGKVTINGKDIREVTVQSLREAIGVVPQEPVLFSGTIRENIRYGRRDASEEDIYAAARAANAEEFIQALENGYETIVGERGVGLSGGQVQRVAIARAFLRDPAVLIMDEPTSNLDATSESLVMAALDRLAKGRTTFIIAHRLSVARDADRIFVIKDGRIVESGRHEELLDQCGAYWTLWQRQIGEL